MKHTPHVPTTTRRRESELDRVLSVGAIPALASRTSRNTCACAEDYHGSR
jgi:hypothetical protein